jgi:hypothetical protein
MNVQDWQALSILERKRLIKEAGYQPNAYAYRAYNFIPVGVRHDIEYVIKRESKQPKQLVLIS